MLLTFLCLFASSLSVFFFTLYFFPSKDCKAPDTCRYALHFRTCRVSLQGKHKTVIVIEHKAGKTSSLVVTKCDQGYNLYRLQNKLLFFVPFNFNLKRIMTNGREETRFLSRRV
jgi:hypothetical protein